MSLEKLTPDYQKRLQDGTLNELKKKEDQIRKLEADHKGCISLVPKMYSQIERLYTHVLKQELT